MNPQLYGQSLLARKHGGRVHRGHVRARYLRRIMKRIDAAGATQQQKDNATATYAYDDLNRRTSMSDPEGRTTTWEYDPVHVQQVKYVRNDNNQIIKENTYDALTGRLLINTSYGVVMSYSYNALGNVIKTTFPDGSYAQNTYDGPRLISQTSRTGNTTSFGYDVIGRRTSTTNALGNVTLQSYDAVGNVLTLIDPLNNITTYSHDEMNRQVSVTLADNRVTENSYDSLGRLISRTGAGSVPVYYTYDPAGRMTELKDGEGNITQFAYDSLGRLIHKSYADNTSYSYSYNARGWLISRTDAKGQTTGYEYNNNGQLTKVDYPTDTDIEYGIDNLGRMTTRTDAAGTWTWSYDAESSRVLTESLSNPSYSSSLSYSYHPNTYDLASVSVGSYTTAYTWSQGRLTQVSASSATSASKFSYSYKPNSDLLETTTYLDGTATVTRVYDAANRLTSVSNNVGATSVSRFSYQYDSTGRRIRCDLSDSSYQGIQGQPLN